MSEVICSKKIHEIDYVTVCFANAVCVMPASEYKWIKKSEARHKREKTDNSAGE